MAIILSITVTGEAIIDIIIARNNKEIQRLKKAIEEINKN